MSSVPVKRHGGSAVQGVPAGFPGIVAVRQVLMDGLTAASYLQTPRTSVPDVPGLRPGAQSEPLMAFGPWGNRGCSLVQTVERKDT